MRTTTTTKFLIAATLVGASLGAAALASGTANACVPDYPATISMNITNNTDYTMFLDGSDNPYGDWIVAPQAQLAPGESETVSASTWRSGGFGIDVTYGMSEDTSAVFTANNYGGSTDTSGTRVDGANPLHWDIFSSVDQGAPNMTASYSILPPLQ